MFSPGNEYLHRQKDAKLLQMNKNTASGCHNNKTKQFNMVKGGTINLRPM